MTVTERLRLLMVEARGGATLARYPGMDGTAQDWADEMARTDTLAHRPQLAPYYGEVVASGADTASTAMTLWMNSPAHRDIILDPSFDKCGIGFNSGYWIVVFS